MNSSYNKGFHNEILGGNNNDWHKGKQDREAMENGGKNSIGLLFFIFFGIAFLFPYAILSLFVAGLMYPFGYRNSNSSFSRFYVAIFLTILSLTLSFTFLGVLLVNGSMKFIPTEYEFVLFPVIIIVCLLSILFGSFIFYLKIKRINKTSYPKSVLITSFLILPLCFTILILCFVIANELYFKHNGMDFLNLA